MKIKIKRTQQKEQRSEATTKPGNHAQQPLAPGAGEQAAPSSVPAEVANPIDPPTVSGPLVTKDIGAK